MKNNMYIEHTMEETEMISLFDYLGKAAGSKLGKEVYQEASKRNIPVQSRNITTKYYNGPVLLYPESFLKEYFKDNKK